MYDKFLAKLIAKTKSMKMGDPFDENTQQGPLIDEAQLNDVLAFVTMAQDNGAEVQTGGSRVPGKGFTF